MVGGGRVAPGQFNLLLDLTVAFLENSLLYKSYGVT